MRITTQKDSNAPRGGGSIMPGFYKATIMRAFEDRDNDGNLFMGLEIRIEAESRPIIRQRIYDSEKSHWRFEQLAAACGWQFKKGSVLDIPASKFVGYTPYVVTYRRRDKDGNGIYTDILHFLRPQDVPHDGLMSPEEMEEYGLNENGESIKQLKAAAARNNGSQQRSQGNSYQSGSYRQPQQGYQQPQSYQQPAPAPEPDMADDDIPF